MKKITALILALVMCMGLTVPAMAAYPETSAEAAKKYSITTEMDIYNNVINEPVQLYDLDIEMDAQTGKYVDVVVESNQWDSYRVIGSDTKITVANTGTGDDYFVIMNHVTYVKDEQGRYVMSDQCAMTGCSMRQGGYFMNRAAFENWDHLPETGMDEADWLMELKAGQSFTLTGAELSCFGQEDASDAMYEVTIFQYYPESDRYWYRSRLYQVDDEKAAEIVAQGKKDDPGNPFVDVAEDAYYHDAVVWALEKGVTTGMTATTFGPDATCTRGQVATFLWRAKGCPEPKTTVNPFTDVKEKDYFYKAVLWAYENGITTGTSATKFDPNGTCTSAHVVTFLWRANGKPAADYTGKEYYAEAVAWANANQLLEGTAVAFAPNNLSPRADIVTYLYRDIAQ